MVNLTVEVEVGFASQPVEGAFVPDTGLSVEQPQS
jgi:hypothetical protein